MLTANIILSSSQSHQASINNISPHTNNPNFSTPISTNHTTHHTTTQTKMPSFKSLFTNRLVEYQPYLETQGHIAHEHSEAVEAARKASSDATARPQRNSADSSAPNTSQRY
jgi:hypothetical protein